MFSECFCNINLVFFPFWSYHCSLFSSNTISIALLQNFFYPFPILQPICLSQSIFCVKINCSSFCCKVVHEAWCHPSSIRLTVGFFESDCATYFSTSCFVHSLMRRLHQVMDADSCFRFVASVFPVVLFPMFPAVSTHFSVLPL